MRARRQSNDTVDGKQPLLLTTYLKYSVSSGTGGQTISSSSYLTLNLNTQEGDTTFCSLSSNQFTLIPGTYRVYAVAPMLFTGASSTTASKMKLRNMTDSSDTLLSQSGRASEANGRDGDKMVIIGQFTISASKTFELQVRGGSLQIGAAVSFGDNEIYQQIEIMKVG